jgi:vacuolar-type H+-ATPase subunit B/Vma2
MKYNEQLFALAAAMESKGAYDNLGEAARPRPICSTRSLREFERRRYVNRAMMERSIEQTLELSWELLTFCQSPAEAY